MYNFPFDIKFLFILENNNDTYSQDYMEQLTFQNEG